MSEMVVWLRGVVEARKAIAEAAAARSTADWYHRPDIMDTAIVRDGNDDTVVYDEGTPTGEEAAHIALNDPRDTIARCDAELAILDEHAPVPDHGRNSGNWPCDEDCSHGDEEIVCRSCRSYVGDPLPYPCRTIDLLASGYRYRDGWKDEWRP